MKFSCRRLLVCMKQMPLRRYFAYNFYWASRRQLLMALPGTEFPEQSHNALFYSQSLTSALCLLIGSLFQPNTLTHNIRITRASRNCHSLFYHITLQVFCRSTYINVSEIPCMLLHELHKIPTTRMHMFLWYICSSTKIFGNLTSYN